MSPRLVCSLLAALAATAAWGEGDRLGFKAAGEEFVFDTGVLKGKVCEGGRAIGLTQVIHIPSGALISRGMGLAAHYRIFTRNRRYGDGAWDWPGRARLNPQNELEVLWPAAEGRPFELSARYRWLAPAALEIETRVRAIEKLPDFETFLGTYLREDFNFAAALAGSPPRWVAASPEHGVWQMFPRDATALGLLGDGRWKIPPSPVEWAVRPWLAEPIAVRIARSLGLAVAVMAPGRDCFAVAMPHHREPHYSLYLSLFGREIRAGETARVRALLVVLSETEGLALEGACRKWLAVLGSGREEAGSLD